MTSIIKNQILKHLSRFAKNLSPDQVNLSALKGEGELRNLELNEEVLTDVLELPSWLRLSGATCDYVKVRIPWTKLKSVPIELKLNEVRVRVETCDELRSLHPESNSLPSSLPGGGGQYGFSHKVVDGLTVSVDSVILTLQSRVFIASFQISNIELESKSPMWAKTDLKNTRLKDTDRKELLIFKELSWQTVKVEAKSTVNKGLTPLRLSTNLARCRITIKKKLTDCSVLGCRLALIIDDLLWVLTDDQLRAALHFADSLSSLIKRATEENQKAKGARKLESLSDTGRRVYNEKVYKKKTAETNVAAQIFASHDVIETSYHFYSNIIDLHLCDDPGGKGSSSHPSLKDGGSFQISLSKLQMDFYPYHLAMSDRSAWIRYNKSVHSRWLENSLQLFKSNLTKTLKSSQYHQLLPKFVDENSSSTNSDSAVLSNILGQYNKLMTANLIVRLSNFTMRKVSTPKMKIVPKEFIKASNKPSLPSKTRDRPKAHHPSKSTYAGDGGRFSLPDDMLVLHLEYTQFYYPGDYDFPIPPPKMYAFVNPIQFYLDPLTCLWLNAFALNLQQSVKSLSVEQSEPPYLDVKVEAIMLRIIYESQESFAQTYRPKSIEIQVSRILAANYRSPDTGTLSEFAKVLKSFHESELFNSSEFPNEESDFLTVCQKFINYSKGLDAKTATLDSSASVLRKDLLWTESKDVWYIYLDPVWADFRGYRSTPLVDAFPITLWLYKEPETSLCNKQQAKMHVICHITKLVSLQIDHFQLLFLIRMSEALSEITTFLTHDLLHILGEGDEGSMSLGVIVPQVDISLLMPQNGNDDTAVVESASVHSDRSSNKTPEKSLNIPLSSYSETLSAPSSPNRPSIPFTESSPDLLKGTCNNKSFTSKKNVNGSVKTRDKLTSSLSNMFASLDSSFRSSSAQLTTQDDEDTISIRSDASSDSESYVVIRQQHSGIGKESVENALFSFNPKVSSVELAEEMTETYEDLNGSSKIDERSLNSEDRIISVVTLHLDNVQLSQQSKGPYFCVKIVAAAVRGEEQSDISWANFQEKFSSRFKEWTANKNSKSKNRCIQLRFSASTPLNLDELLEPSSISLKDKISRSADNFIDVQVQNLPLQFHMSHITGMVDLIEDEVIPTPTPMNVQIRNVALHLIEDRPPNNSTSPGSVPIDLTVSSLRINRDKSGTFSISPGGSGHASLSKPLDSEPSDAEQSVSLLTIDNDNLREALAGSQNEITSLKGKLQEHELHKQTMAQAEEQISVLEKENESMKQTLKYLQQELLKSGKKPTSFS